MADKRQQSKMGDQDIPISNEFSQIEDLKNAPNDKDLIIEVSKDSVINMEHEAVDYIQSSSNNNNHSSILTENIHHLSDHSYINSSHTGISEEICDINSQDTDSSDACTKQETDKELLRSPIQSLDIANNSSDINTQALEPTVVNTGLNKICFNGSVLSIQSNKHSSKVDSYSDLETTNNSAITTDSSCIKSATETSLLGNYNPLFVINNLDTPTLSTPSTSHDLSSLSINIPVKQTNAPLGSVQNPIQIIQNGSSYLATQALTEAQKHQITHVLQKQQAKKALETEGKSVVYDPSTNTRIVCRIVHPSELHSKISSKVSTPEPTRKKIQFNQMNSFRGRGRPKKLQSKKNKDEEKINPALSKEEREEKKKHRPRTRSGRISKPPSYMVKDYKRIHHLDFHEEPFNDSDGGYSDYRVSGDEAENRAHKSLPPGKSSNAGRDLSFTYIWIIFLYLVGCLIISFRIMLIL